MSTPLRLLNNKEGAIRSVSELIPAENNIIHSPFFCHGGLEVKLNELEKTVIGYTNFQPVIDFWACLLNEPEWLYEVAKTISGHRYITNKWLYDYQKYFHSHVDEFHRAAYFYILNRVSKDGTITYGELMENRKYLNTIALMKLKSFEAPNLRVSYMNTKNILKIVDNISDDFMVCTPPAFTRGILNHAVPSTLENPKIDHMKFCDILKSKSNWINIYKFNPILPKLYKEFDITYVNKYWRKTTKENAEEMIIANV